VTSDRTRTLHERAQRIPGGGHTYSKGDDQFPANAPKLIERGEGAYCWDTDGERWLDYGMGLRTVILGHAYPAVLDAVRDELVRGSNFTRPAPIEGELAEILAEICACGEMTKFAKNGSDVTSAATRLARAYTGRPLIAACKDNPFYSFDDWWIGVTPRA
jgi:glutamate-1-semialdehyde 2,1-aminomutase